MENLTLIRHSERSKGNQQVTSLMSLYEWIAEWNKELLYRATKSRKLWRAMVVYTLKGTAQHIEKQQLMKSFGACLSYCGINE